MNKEKIKEFRKIAKEGQKNSEKLGIKEKDVPEMIHRLRKSKELI